MGKCFEDTWNKYYEQGVIKDTIKKIVTQNVNDDFNNSINEIKDNTSKSVTSYVEELLWIISLNTGFIQWIWKLVHKN
jgi:hypothetical protein